MALTPGILKQPAIQIGSATNLATNDVVVSTLTSSNVVGDTQSQGAPRYEAALNLGTVSAGAFSTTVTTYVWFLQQKDGVNSRVILLSQAVVVMVVQPQPRRRQ